MNMPKFEFGRNFKVFNVAVVDCDSLVSKFEVASRHGFDMYRHGTSFQSCL